LVLEKFNALNLGALDGVPVIPNIWFVMLGVPNSYDLERLSQPWLEDSTMVNSYFMGTALHMGY